MAKDKKWTSEEVIERGLQAIGTEVERLARTAEKQDLDEWEAERLTSFVKAACLVGKEERDRKVGKLDDEQLMRAIAAELGIGVPQLQDFIATCKAAKGARAS